MVSKKGCRRKSKIHIPLSKHKLESGIQRRIKKECHLVRVLCWDNFCSFVLSRGFIRCLKSDIPQTLVRHRSDMSDRCLTNVWGMSDFKHLIKPRDKTKEQKLSQQSTLTRWHSFLILLWIPLSNLCLESGMCILDLRLHPFLDTTF